MENKFNKYKFTQLVSETVMDFMTDLKEFRAADIIAAIPVSETGVDFSKLRIDDRLRQNMLNIAERVIQRTAEKNEYVQSADGIWKPLYDDSEFSDVALNVFVKVLDRKEELRNKSELVAPFYNFVRKMRALLGADPDVTVLEDEDNKTINICVAGCAKPEAYRIFFPGSFEIKGIGMVTILVNGHKKSHKTVGNEQILRTMFVGHPLVYDIILTHFPNGKPNRLFVLFKNQTVQFINDNFGSLTATTTTTAEELAREVMIGSGMTIWWSTVSEFPLVENDKEVVE